MARFKAKLPDYGQAKKNSEKDNSQVIENSDRNSINQVEIRGNAGSLDSKSQEIIKKVKEDLLRHRKSKKMPIEVTLLNFTDFVKMTDKRRISFVRSLKLKTQSSPSYWTVLKNAIRKFHKGEITLDELRELPQQVDEKRKINYTKAIESYIDFIIGKDCKWFNPIKGKVLFGNVGVKINPFLGLIINGQKALIMLYMRKDEPLSENRAISMITLMKNGINSDEFQCLILDVVAHQPYPEKYFDQNSMAFLQKEALNLEKIWNGI